MRPKGRSLPTGEDQPIGGESGLTAGGEFEALVGFDLRPWFGVHGRDLPWRRTRDPWAILVSEVMLQQTQVARVVERWEPFLAAFPNPAACARADRADIIGWWRGMGFNRRAVNLHRAAEVVTSDHAGRVPSTLAELLALPGVGAYTARAVLVFAYEAPYGVLDTNVARILARTANRSLGRREAQEAADALGERAAGNDPWTWNQALLDIGAGRCRPTPRCDGCPLADRCAWSAAGRPEPDPASASAGVSKPQSRFEGSDRQGRGRLVDALRRGCVPVWELADVMEWPDDQERAVRVAATVVADGLARVDGDVYRLV